MTSLSDQRMTEAIAVTDSYDLAAGEYYDALRHPTCRNFGEASRRLLQSYAASDLLGHTLEVGCGMSTVAEILTDRQHPLDQLVLSDASRAMIEHSRKWSKQGARLLVAEADSLPFMDGSFGALVASLGDPYNTRRFWEEAHRCLRGKGLVFFTTPSFRWASDYRASHRYLPSESEFLLEGGTELRLPSHILQESEQLALIESCGFAMQGVGGFRIGHLTSPISPKLAGHDEDDVVVIYVAAKRA